MRTPSYATQFERDLRLMQRRGKDIEKLKALLTALIDEEPLPAGELRARLFISSRFGRSPIEPFREVVSRRALSLLGAKTQR